MIIPANLNFYYLLLLSIRYPKYTPPLSVAAETDKFCCLPYL